MKEIDKDREGKTVDKERVSAICRMYRKIGYFDEHFRSMFVSFAEEHYRKYRKTLIPIKDLVDYTRVIGGKIEEERSRCEFFLDDSLAQTLQFLMRRILIDEILPELLNSNFEKLLSESKNKELKFYYENMKGHETFDTFLSFFEQFVKNRTEANFTAKENVIEQLLKFYDDLILVLQSVYSGDLQIKAGLDRGFEAMISKNDSHFTKLFAQFVSQLMERGSASSNSERAITDGMQLFRFVQNKKVFIATYNQK